MEGTIPTGPWEPGAPFELVNLRASEIPFEILQDACRPGNTWNTVGSDLKDAMCVELMDLSLMRHLDLADASHIYHVILVTKRLVGLPMDSKTVVKSPSLRCTNRLQDADFVNFRCRRFILPRSIELVSTEQRFQCETMREP